MIRFLLAGMKLIAAAMVARDASGGGIATNRKSVERNAARRQRRGGWAFGRAGRAQ